MEKLLPADHPDMASVRRSFEEVDRLVGRFFDRYRDAGEARVTGRVGWQNEPLTVTPLWLFSHTVTHEFHHKGQVVTLGRRLGFPPADTDLVLPAPM